MALVAQKGGTGKTTLALLLAVVARAGRTAVVLDIDPAGGSLQMGDRRCRRVATWRQAAISGGGGMRCEVVKSEEFHVWWGSLPKKERNTVTAALERLQERGVKRDIRSRRP